MNRLRVIFLSLFVLAMVAGALPLTESLAKWSRHAAAGNHRRYKHHSRAWWRRHRARLRARRARAERLRRERLDTAQTGQVNDGARAPQTPGNANASILSFDGGAASSAQGSQMPFDFVAPHTWTPARRARTGQAVFNVQAPDGHTVGTAVVAPVALKASELAGVPSNAKTKSVGGVPVSALRRTVIDRMVAEGGWVTNDLVQEIHGRRVFVVLAQTGAPGAPARSWAFYFTEVDGRVYSLATTSPIEFADPVAAGSVQLMATLKSASDSNTAARK